MNTLTIPGDGTFNIRTIPIPKPRTTPPRLVANLEFSAFMPDHIDFVAYFATHAAHKRDIPTSEKVIHMPTEVKKWHVTKGPFVHDKSKEIFEMKTFKRLVQAFDADAKVVEDWVSYVNSSLPAGVELKVQKFEWETLSPQLKSNLLNSVQSEEKQVQATKLLTKAPKFKGDQETESVAEGNPQEAQEEAVEVKGSGMMTRKEYEKDIRARADAFIKANMPKPKK
ncbi:mitochondrial 37S ribosomal protein rsm10 [Chytridiales sp. JEL 0842]|nr:mitochondrial 37S ribosomal protein rsm10 [Chytridiales sp. JEL 0842]